MKIGVRSLNRAVALAILAIICVWGAAGTALAVLPCSSGSILVREDGGVTPSSAALLVANDGNTAADAYSGSSSDLAVNEPVISGVTAVGVTTTSATIIWETNEQADGRVEYGETTAYGSGTIREESGFFGLTSHSVSLTGLSPQTTYHFRVISTGWGFSNTSESEDYTFTTLDGVAPVISGVTATNVTATSATVTWTTDEAADSEVEYGPNASYGLTATAPGLVTSHSVNLTGLGTRTKYHYRVKSTDPAGNPAQSSNYTFDTLDATAPVISVVKVVSITATGATITWTTDEGADGQVEYGPTTAYGSATTLDTTLVTSHSVNLTGLNSGTAYHCRAKSKDASGNLAQSGDYTFTTLDNTAPVISVVKVVSITATGATITWTTDEEADSQVEYGPTISYGSATTLGTILVTTHSVSLTSLGLQTTYHYRVKSKDAWGNPAQSEDHVFTTLDNTAPVISGVTATNIAATSATITWSTDAAAESQVGYGTKAVYDSTTTLDTNRVANHIVSLSGLNPQTTYHYRVKSRDGSGLWAESADYTFTTGTGTGDGAPPVISSVTATNVTGSGATIKWATDQAMTTQVEYGLTEEYGSFTEADANLVNSHSVALTGLKASSDYHYRVISKDAAGNQAESADKTFTTAMKELPSLMLPTWAWAVIGLIGAVVVGALVIFNV